jgi:hypothetical protein
LLFYKATLSYTHNYKIPGCNKIAYLKENITLMTAKTHQLTTTKLN